MKLVDISIGTHRKSNLLSGYGGTVWSITSLYLYCLEKYETKAYRKVAIYLINDNNEDNKIESLLNVLVIHKFFNFESFKIADKFQQKKMMLDVMQKSLIVVAENEGWEIQPLKNAYQCCIEKKLEHKWLREGRYILSPDRKYYAGIFCNWDSDIFEVFAVFLNKEKREIKREKLYESDPAFVEPMGKMMWDKESSSKFILFSKDGKQRWEAKI
jgi:hypothetical protein